MSYPYYRYDDGWYSARKFQHRDYNHEWLNLYLKQQERKKQQGEKEPWYAEGFQWFFPFDIM